MLVETLNHQYSRYYRAVDENPPFSLHAEQLGAVMNSADLNKSIKDKFRLSLDLDPRYFMLARCIVLCYYLSDDNADRWLGFSIDQIIEMAKMNNIHCLEKLSKAEYMNLLDEMVDMYILSKPDEEKKLYRLRRNSFISIIGSNIDEVEEDIRQNNKEAEHGTD